VFVNVFFIEDQGPKIQNCTTLTVILRILSN